MPDSLLNFDTSAAVDLLHAQGWFCVDNAIDSHLTKDLYHQLDSMQAAEFKQAGIGRATNHQLDVKIRGDKIHWIKGETECERSYLRAMDELRLKINQDLFLGLFSFEAHFAYYPVGQYYKKHFDAFKTGSERKLSTVLYLNPNWTPDQGGELVLYEPEGEKLITAISPNLGRLVCFLSSRFPHEVLPAQRMRYSLTGWFRTNSPLSHSI